MEFINPKPNINMDSPFASPHFTRFVILAAVFLFLTSTCTLWAYCGAFSTINASLVSLTPKLVVIAFLFIFVKLITSSIKLILQRREGREKPKFFSALHIARYGLWIFFSLTSATLLFGDVGALLTSLGLIGFGVTFALQKPLLNFVAWISINFHKLYEVGDRVRIGNVKGDVTEIQMMHTIIKGILEGSDSPSGRYFSIPNELTLTQPVENFTKDNNFINEELKIAITYESDWRKAKNILNSIVSGATKKNLHRLKVNLNRRMSLIDATIDKLSERIARAKTKEREEKIKGKITVLQEEKKSLAETFEDIPQQFRPQIHVEMGDSAIVLIAQFVTPYDMVRNVKTEINSAFLDAAKREKNVSIAYPHMELVLNKNGAAEEKESYPSSQYKTLYNFLQIRNIDLDEPAAKKPR